MRILDKKGVLTIVLTQDEGRRLRDAAYIVRRIGRNIIDDERAGALSDAADNILAVVDEFCPKTEKLDQQDAETPPAGVEQGQEQQQPAKKKK